MVYICVLYKPSVIKLNISEPSIYKESQLRQIVFTDLDVMIERIAEICSEKQEGFEPAWQYTIHFVLDKVTVGFDSKGWLYGMPELQGEKCPWNESITISRGMYDIRHMIDNKVNELKAAESENS